MSVAFQVSDIIPATPQVLYHAWLNSDEHSKMTGSPAQASAVVGGAFQAWDGYIDGTNVELEEPHRILQNWRTTEFSADDPDSRLEITFAVEGDATRITIDHSELPDHGMQYQQGWIDAYFTPMKAYFSQAA